MLRSAVTVVFAGVDVCRIVRQAGYCLPILAMTAHVDVTSVTKYKEAGFNGLLGKPFSSEFLSQLVFKVLLAPTMTWCD